MRTASAIAGFVLTLSTTTALAKDCKGINFPDHAVVEGTDLTLNGVGLHKATFLRVDVYVGALYVAATSRDPNTLINSERPQELILHFLRSVNVKDVREQWTKDFVHVVPDRPASLMQRVATLNTWLSDMKSDQRLTFVRQPGEGIKVVVGGVLKGTVPGDDFSRVFMSIWLGAAPPSAGLRAGLLGGPCDEVASWPEAIGQVLSSLGLPRTRIYLRRRNDGQSWRKYPRSPADQMHGPTSRLHQPIAILRARPSAALDRCRLQPIEQNRGDPACTLAPREITAVRERSLAETLRERWVAGQSGDPRNEGINGVWLAQQSVSAVLQDLPDVGSITGENRSARAHVEVEFQRDDGGAELGERLHRWRNQQQIRGENVSGQRVRLLPGDDPDVL